MNTLILEEEAQEAIELAEALPDRPDVLNASATLVRAYKAQQEKLGRPLFPQAEKRKTEDFQRVRGYFTNRETYGLDDDTRAGLLRDLPDEEQRAALFSEEFLARAFQKPTKEVRALGPLLRDQYALERWGEPVKTYKEFYDRQAAEFDFEDTLARKATAAALSNMGPLDAFADLETENAANALYTGRRKQWRDQFSEIAAAERDRLAPYKPTVQAVADILQAKTGTGGEGTEDESYRQLAGYLMEVPKEDRDFVIAAIAAAGANDEAGRKGVMKKLAESFGRGLVDYRENIPASLERGQVLAARRRIEAGLLVDAGSVTPDGILGAALAQGGAVSDSMTSAPVPQNPVELSEQDKAQALALADELIDGIDLRAKLRSAAENQIDPVTSDWMVMRGLYAGARSLPYTLAAIAPGGFVLNTLAMTESSYQQLRAANPDMTAGQAQAISVVSGPLKAGIERISGNVLTGRLPVFNRFANQVILTRGAALGRFGARAGVSTGIEILQENAQDLTPFAIQGITSALNEDVPGIPWDVIGEQFSADNQGELFFAVLPLALFGAGVGTARDFAGVTSDVTNYDFLRIFLGSDAVAADVRSKYVNGDEKGAQAAMRARMQEIGTDQKAYQEVRREAIPKYLAEREAMQKALNEAGELDILPAILRERDKWTLRYNSGENAQFDTYDEAFSRWESVASSSVAALHEDMISATRYAVAGMDRGREAKLIVSPFQPIAEDKIAEGVATEEDIQQREEIAAADKPLAAKTEERRVKALANLAATSSESRKVASLILGESVNNVAPPDSFGDRVIRTTAKVYQGATPFTIIEEFAEGDAKYLIQEAGVPRAWFIDTLREWEKTTGDTLFRKSIKDPADIKNSDIIEAYSKMVVSYFAGKASKEENGLALSKGTRGMIAKALRGDLGAVLTGYAGMFEAIYRRSAMLDKARRDGTLDDDLEGFLAKSTGMSEQRVFEREVQREASGIAEELSANPDFSSADSTGATFSLLPDASNLDSEFARMFSPFQRSPELRMKLGQEMLRRVLEMVQKLRPILRANRTKKSIEAERKTRQEELFSEKLDLLSPGEVQALSNTNLLEDNSLQPILSELLTEKTRKTKGGKTVRYWQGSLMSKSEAKRRGIDVTGGEWDAIPEGLPPYVWGGSITPDQAATMFGFDRPEMFFDALAGEIQARADRKAEIEAANRRVRELEREAREESRAWAEQAMKDRETVGSDRATLLGFLRTLEAITRALPAEVRGKIGGSVALAKLTTPAAMLDEIEARVEMIDRELERWMQKEATEQVEAFFEKVAKSKNSKAGEAANGKKNLPEIYKVMALAEKAFKLMSAEEGQSEGLRLQGLVDSGAIADDDVAATLMAAELIPLFSGWNGKTRDEVIDGKTKRIRIASPSDSAQKTAALEAAKQIWTEGVLEWKTRQAEMKERRDSIRQQGEEDIAKANKLRTRDEREILDKGRASLPGKFALNLQSFDGFFRWHLGDNSSVYKWITDSERKAANAYDDAVRNISKSVDDWFTKKAGSRFKGEKLRQKMAETYVELTPEKGEVRKLSQLQLITAQLIWRQEDGKRHMKGRRDDDGNIVSSWSYGDGFMAQVDAAMSEEAQELMDFLSDAYDKEYEPLNKVYRKLFGIDLPKHLLYSPLTVKPEIKNDAGADPVTGFFSGGLSGIAGALKTRGTSIVEPDFKDALQVYVAHSMQMEHFKAFAELARDARAIFGRVSFRDQIKRASGDEGITVLDGLLEVLDKGGIRSSGVYLESTKTLEKLTGRLSTMILFGKLQTIALNVTQLAAASVEMGPRTYWKQFAKLWFSPTDWAEALRTPYIQRRIDEMPPVIRQAIESNRKIGPSRLADINDKLGYGISATDGFFTAGTYAMVYDWKKQEAARLGVPAESVEAFARNETERIMDRLAQPTRKGARSIYENNMSAEGRVFFNFISEARKNMALLSYAAQRDRSKLAGTAQFVILSAAISTLLRAGWQDLRDDDEDNDAMIWHPGKLALELVLDPLYGIPVVGGMLQDAIKAGFGFKTFGGTILESGQSAIPAARRLIAWDYDADEIDRIAGDVNAILGALGYFSRRAAALTSITNVVEDALKVYDNLIGE